MLDFLSGVATAGSWAIGLLFVRLWRDTGDRFFGFFGMAFWVMSLNWLGLALLAPADEHRHYFYLTRLAAFLLIIAAILHKNRPPKN